MPAEGDCAASAPLRPSDARTVRSRFGAHRPDKGVEVERCASPQCLTVPIEGSVPRHHPLLQVDRDQFCERNEPWRLQWRVELLGQATPDPIASTSAAAITRTRGEPRPNRRTAPGEHRTCRLACRTLEGERHHDLNGMPGTNRAPRRVARRLCRRPLRTKGVYGNVPLTGRSLVTLFFTATINAKVWLATRRRDAGAVPVVVSTTHLRSWARPRHRVAGFNPPHLRDDSISPDASGLVPLPVDLGFTTEAGNRI